MNAKSQDLEARADALAQLVEQLRETLALVGDELWELRAALRRNDQRL